MRLPVRFQIGTYCEEAQCGRTAHTILHDCGTFQIANG